MQVPTTSEGEANMFPAIHTAGNRFESLRIELSVFAPMNCLNKSMILHLPVPALPSTMPDKLSTF
jgi:hypothetical protein